MSAQLPLVLGANGPQQLQLGDNLANNAMMNTGTDVQLTINNGVITVTGSRHKIVTESLAASDNLDTINGGGEGDILVIRAEDSSRTVVVRSGQGNIRTGDNGASRTLDNDLDTIVLQFTGTEWNEIWFQSTGT